jgi:hypothetical protein
MKTSDLLILNSIFELEDGFLVLPVRQRANLLITPPRIPHTPLPSTRFHITIQEHDYRLITFIFPVLKYHDYGFRSHHDARTMAPLEDKKKRCE